MASLTAKVLKGSLLSFAIKFVQKSLGLISTLILARILTPEDFGIVAIAALILHFCDVLSTAGSEAYLIQKSHLEKDDINSSWTLELFLKTLLFLLFLASTPFIAAFYEDPNLVSVLSVSSLVLFINAFKSPGIALLKKDLKYKKLFILNVTQKLLVFTFIMIWVFVEPSFWALIVGDVVSAFILMVGSYFIHNYRPKLCFKKIKEQWAFSKYIMLKSGVGYSRAQMDVFFVAKYYSAELVGTYHLARHLAMMPNTDVLTPAIEPLLSSFSKVKENTQSFQNQFKMSFLVVICAIVPIAIFMYSFPNLVIDVLLGSQWEQAHTILSSLTLLLVANTINQLLVPYCVAMGRVKTLFYYDLVSFIFVLVGLYYFSALELYYFALLRGILAAIPILILLFYVCRLSGLSFVNLILNLFAVSIFALMAMYAVQLFHTYVELHVFFDLVLSSLIFFSVFIGLIGLVSFGPFTRVYEWGKLSELALSGISKIFKK